MSSLSVLLAIVGLGAAPAPADLSLADAETALRRAPAFADGLVGEGAEFPIEIAAFRRVLASRDAAERFRRLVAEATPAGQVYALCGLFFLDPAAFDREIATLRAGDAMVVVQEGCIVVETSLASVLAPAAGAPRLSHADDLREWLRKGFGAAVSDVAGGGTCHRLRFGSTFPTGWVEDPRKAPGAEPPWTTPGDRHATGLLTEITDRHAGT